MRPLLRWILSGAAAVSAVLFVGVCVLWVRSYVIGDSWIRYLGGDAYTFHTLASGRGRFRVSFSDDRAFSGWPLPEGHCTDNGPDKGVPDLAGFGMRRRGIPGVWLDEAPPIYWAVTVHFALIAPFAAVIPVWRLWWPFRHRGDVRLGLCPSCGYDLRATPSRCPECGHVPAGKAET